jgi:hypothetical protein
VSRKKSSAEEGARARLVEAANRYAAVLLEEISEELRRTLRAQLPTPKERGIDPRHGHGPHRRGRRPGPERYAVVEDLREHPGSLPREVAERLNLESRAVSGILDRLRASGKATRAGTKSNYRYTLYETLVDGLTAPS